MRKILNKKIGKKSFLLICVIVLAGLAILYFLSRSNEISEYYEDTEDKVPALLQKYRDYIPDAIYERIRKNYVEPTVIAIDDVSKRSLLSTLLNCRWPSLNKIRLRNIDYIPNLPQTNQEKMPGLKHLILINVEGEYLESLTSLPSLEKLYVNGIKPHADKGSGKLAISPNVQDLSLRNVDVNIDDLYALKKLAHLRLAGTNVAVIEYAKLAEQPIWSLSLEAGNNVIRHSMGKGNDKIRLLSLYGKQDYDGLALRKLPSLELLKITDGRICNSLLNELAFASELTQLSLVHIENLRDQDAAIISKCRSLTRLIVKDNQQLSLRFIEGLSANDNLAGLSVQGTGIALTDEVVDQLLQKFKNLTWLGVTMVDDRVLQRKLPFEIWR